MCELLFGADKQFAGAGIIGCTVLLERLFGYAASRYAIARINIVLLATCRAHGKNAVDVAWHIAKQAVRAAQVVRAIRVETIDIHHCSCVAVGILHRQRLCDAVEVNTIGVCNQVGGNIVWHKIDVHPYARIDLQMYRVGWDGTAERGVPLAACKA